MKVEILVQSFPLLGLIALLTGMAFTVQKPRDYVMVMDTGSSWTRLYIYDWEWSEGIDLLIAAVFEEKKITPGIQEFSSKLDEIPEYLYALKEYAVKNWERHIGKCPSISWQREM